MGSFYGAQFFAKATEELPSLEVDLKNGNTKSILAWLQANIYQHGRTMASEDLCTSVCGKPLDIQYFLDYILAKHKNIYNF
jgi:carboxypeptidase Taq